MGGGFRRYLALLKKNARQMIRSPGYLIAELIVFGLLFAGACLAFLYANSTEKDESYETKSSMTNATLKVYNTVNMFSFRRVLVAKGDKVNERDFNSWIQQHLLRWEVEIAEKREELAKILQMEAEADVDKEISLQAAPFGKSYVGYAKYVAGVTALNKLMQLNEGRVPKGAASLLIAHPSGINNYQQSQQRSIKRFIVAGLYLKELNDREGKYDYEIVVNKKYFMSANVADGWQNKHSRAYEFSGCHYLQADVDFTFNERAKICNNANVSVKVNVCSYEFELNDPSGLGISILLDMKNLIVITMVIFTVRGIMFDKEYMKKLNIPLVLLANCVEFFVIIAFTLVMSSLFKSAAVTTLAALVSFFSLMVWGWFGDCTPHQEGYCIATFLNPFLAKNMFITILTSVKNTHKSYSISNLFQWKSFHFPGSVPLAFMILDLLLMVVIFIVITKGRQFSCRRKKITTEDDEKMHVFSDAEEKVDIGNAEIDIQIKDVTKVFKTGQRAVHGLNLEALRGQVTVLLGHNGAGKTTRFSMICGTEKPTEGFLEICGQPAGSAAAKEHIGYCSQKNTLLRPLTVQDHPKLAYDLKCATSNFFEEMYKLLRLVGLLDYKTKASHTKEMISLRFYKTKILSGGQKRKLCLCMALIGESRVVLLDEPTAGMDIESRQEIETFLDSEKENRTVLLTTHYMDEAECLGDRVFIMSGGRVVCSGSPDFLKKRFASGYTLTILADSRQEDMVTQAKKLESYIRRHVRDAKLGEIRGVPIDFELSSESQNRFPSLFEDLEQNKEDIGIASFGLSMGNLEQVFLKVGHATNHAEDKEKKEERARGLLKEVYEDDYESGCALVMAQFAALFGSRFGKKLRYSINRWPIVLFVQLGLPLFILCLYGFSAHVKIRSESAHHIDLISFGSLEFLSQNLFPTGKDNFKPYVDKYLNEQLKTNDKMKLIELKGRNVSEMYYYAKNKFDDPLPGMAITYGIECDQEKCTNANQTRASEFVLLRYNLRHLYSLPTVLNVFANTKLRNVTAAREKHEGLGFVFLLTMLMALVFATITEPLAEDVTSGFMNQQILAGAPVWLYWTVEYIYAFLLYAIQCSIYLTCMHLAGGLNVENLLRAVLITVILFYSVMPVLCWLSNKCKTASSATVTITMILTLGIMAGAILQVSIALLFITMKISPKYLDYFMYATSAVCPSFPFLQGMSIIVQIQNQQNQKQADPVMMDKLTFYFRMYVLTAAVMGTLQTLFFVLSRFKAIRRSCSCKGSKSLIPAPISNNREANIPSENAVLDVQDLSKVFRRKCALAHVSFKVQKNECFGLLGVSGAGKTTAFNIITGQMSILAKIHGYKDVDGVVENLIEIVDMDEHAGKEFGTCSGGQKRRLSMAAALLPRKSPFAILDEATAGIDPVARRDVWSVLSVVREHSAILMSSHSMEECDALCNRIATLRNGQIAATGSSQELKSKLGNFYVLSMTLPSPTLKHQALTIVNKHFPGATTQKGSFFRNMKWKLPRLEGDLWSNVFERCQKIANEIGASNFCVSQKSLQDIFLIIATYSDKRTDYLASTNRTDSGTSTATVTKTAKQEVTGKSVSESTKKSTPAESDSKSKTKGSGDTEGLNEIQKSTPASVKQSELKKTPWRCP